MILNVLNWITSAWNTYQHNLIWINFKLWIDTKLKPYGIPLTSTYHKNKHRTEFIFCYSLSFSGTKMKSGVFISVLAVSFLLIVKTSRADKFSSLSPKKRIYMCIHNCAICVKQWERGWYNGGRCAKRCIRNKGSKIIDPNCNKLSLFRLKENGINIKLRRFKKRHSRRRRPAWLADRLSDVFISSIPNLNPVLGHFKTMFKLMKLRKEKS